MLETLKRHNLKTSKNFYEPVIRGSTHSFLVKQNKKTQNNKYKPLLLPSLSRNMVNSSIAPKGENIIRRSSSVAFLDIIPIKSLRSSKIMNKRKSYLSQMKKTNSQ